MIWDQSIFYRRGYGATPVVFVLVPLISLGGFLLFSTLYGTQTPEIIPTANQEHASQEDTSIDSDQDGLKDWEEQIYATDAHNPDTDGDGAKDGDEIAQNRDPLKKGPDDTLTKVDTSATTAASSNAYTGDQFNLTKKIAEEFSQDYLTRIAQNPENQLDSNAFADKIMQITREQAPPSISLVTTSDIIISRNAVKDDMVRYLKQLNALVLNPSKPLPDAKSISDAVAGIVHTEDAARTSAASDHLAMYVNQYNQLLTDVKTISVPKDFVSLHIDFLNTTIKERNALEKIQHVKSDPFTALMGFREYMETTKKFLDLRKQYRELAILRSASTTHQ